MTKHPQITRMLWRLGRSLYMRARGEQRFGDIARNGEAHLQRCLIENGPQDSRLMVMDIGANQGDWTDNFLKAFVPESSSRDRLVLHAFEPVPATAKMFRDRIARLPGNEVTTQAVSA